MDPFSEEKYKLTFERERVLIMSNSQAIKFTSC